MRLFFPIAVAMVSLVFPLSVSAQTKYMYGPDSQEQAGVPKGEVTYFKFTTSKIYPGSDHDCWIYVPKQYDGKTPACVMVFNDGGGYQDRNGQWRTPTVMDNLIAKGDMPVTISVFVSPGVAPAANDKSLPRFNRSVEYDTVDDTYARFISQEILPEVSKKYKLTSDPDGRAICGASSGGIASFTAAWYRPDLFHRVVTFIGSFTDLRGGNTFPSQIRKTEVKPLRIFMQDGSNDQDIYSGAWFIGNNDVAAALRFAGYPVEYVVGDGGHSGEQGGTILPDALRFVWKGYPEPVKPTPSGRQPVTSVLIAGEDWQPVPLGDNVTVSGAIAADPDGNIYVTDSDEKVLYRIGLDGKAATVSSSVGGKVGAVGPDGNIYVIRTHEIVALDKDGKEGEKKPVEVTALTIANDGTLYALNEDGAVLFGKFKEHLQATSSDNVRSQTLLLSPDQSLLFVSPSLDDAKYITSYRITKAGVTDGERYHDLATVYGHTAPFAIGMTADANGWLYVGTETGIQMVDQAGRVNGIILPPPTPKAYPVKGLAFGGEGKSYLYTTAGGKVYRRKTQAKGVVACDTPVKPPAPRL